MFTPNRHLSIPNNFQFLKITLVITNGGTTKNKESPLRAPQKQEEKNNFENDIYFMKKLHLKTSILIDCRSSGPNQQHY